MFLFSYFLTFFCIVSSVLKLEPLFVSRLSYLSIAPEPSNSLFSACTNPHSFHIRCGDIFCSAHCSKAVPLDQALDFNPAMGVISRACTGCFEAYEQWQGLIPSNGTTFTSQQSARGTFGSVSDSHIPGEYSTHKGSPLSKPAGSSPSRKNTGHIPDGLLAGSTSSNETLGRDGN